MSQINFVQKIWSLCHILRGDGITYYQYISELSYLLFLKIAQENGSESMIQSGYRWSDLEKHETNSLLGFYQEMLTHLGASAKSETVRAIYAFPTTVFSHSENLKAVINGIAELDWHEVGNDSFGPIYEGLIDKSAEARSGAGQYFTPRALIDSIVRLTKPKLGEQIQDPASGSGGFLVSADNFIRLHSSPKDYKKRPPRYQGVEIEKNTRRICLMNTFLHDLDAEIVYGDALTDDSAVLKPADLILANPPFGTKAGSRRKLRSDLPYPKSNKQLAFLQHIYLGLNEGGRAAVVLPDNILFEDGIGKVIRNELMETCNLHTILRLPTGIFSSAGVKTNVLFFTKNKKNGEITSEIWYYDLRTNMPRFGKTTPLKSKHFTEFESSFGEDPFGKSSRIDQGPDSRFRCFTRKFITDRDDNLDITWLREKSQSDEIIEPEDIAAEIMAELQTAMDAIEILTAELEKDEAEPVIVK